MLETSLDPIPSAPLTSTIEEHAPSHHPASRRRVELLEALEEMLNVATQLTTGSEYERARAEEQSWEALCELLDSPELGEELLEEALMCATRACSSWQDQSRVAPRRWLDRMFAGGEEPRLLLARHIDLRGVSLTSAQMSVLSSCEQLEHVTILRLDEANLSSLAAKKLSDSPYLHKLRELYLGHNALDDAAIAALARSRNLTQLEVLSLAANQIGDLGVGALARSPYLRRVRELYLNQNQIGDGGIEALALGTGSHALERIYLYENTRISDKGAELLRRRRELAFPNLIEVDLYDCSVSEALCERLSAMYLLTLQSDRERP